MTKDRLLGSHCDLEGLPESSNQVRGQILGNTEKYQKGKGKKIHDIH